MIDFTKHKKELRIYATLFELDPVIFDVEYFVDINTDKEFLLVLYSKKPSNKILYIILRHEYYYNNTADNGLLIFKFKLRTEKQNHDFSLMQTNGTLFFDKQFILKMCIHWKKYIDESFFYCID